jgi:ferredoxin
MDRLQSGAFAMSLSIDRDKCQGHGRCTLASSELFDVGEDGFGVVLNPEPGPEHDAEVAAAIGSCPEEAISRT